MELLIFYIECTLENLALNVRMVSCFCKLAIWAVGHLNISEHWHVSKSLIGFGKSDKLSPTISDIERHKVLYISPL